MGQGTGQDFFISYTGVNRPWAEWIAVELEQAGYTTVLQAWDFRPGTDFVHKMQEAASNAGRTIAVLSPAYFGSEFGETEWRAAFVKDPTGELGLLVPVRVQPCEPPGLLASRVYVDLVDVDESAARRKLLAGVDASRPRPTTAIFPGGPGSAGDGQKRFPGLGPEVSNLPSRNRNFSGREGLLERLHASLSVESAAAVVPTEAVHGLGGVGKTQLALEYAHRFGSDYDLIWWIAAEQPTTAVAALAELARRLGLPVGADQSETVVGLFDLLRGQARWLLIYDDAERPDQLAGLLPPGGGGHVLVTSRWSAWGSDAASLPLSVLAREESLEFLLRRTGVEDQVALDELAELVGDLPLALEEAAAYLEETQDSLGAYLGLVRDRARELFTLEGPVADEHRDRRRVGTVWSVSLDRVRAEAPAAEALLNLCAFLAPDLPRELPMEQPQALPDELAEAVTDRLAYNRMLAAIGRYSLAAVSPTSVGLHRLVQAVIQARLGEAGERVWAEITVKMLRVTFPDESWEVKNWPQCERLMPHLFAVAGHAGRLGVSGEATGWLLDRAATYLRKRGQYRQAEPIAKQALAITESALGPDHPEVAWRCDELGRVLFELGDLASAREQSERAIAIGEAALGPDGIEMGIWRGNLGKVLQNLGDVAGAQEQYEQAITIGEATLGPDHPNIGTLRNNFGSVLRAKGDLAGALEQYELSLAIIEAALGPDHPNMSTSRNNLGGVLRAVGDLAGAREQLEHAVAIDEAALGPDHPDTGILRGNLGSVLRDLGDLAGAQTQYERALAIVNAALGPDHPHTGVLGNYLVTLRRLQRERFQSDGEEQPNA